MADKKHNQGSSDSHHTEHHIMPFGTYLKVASALFLLTFMTIGAHMFKQHYLPLAPFIAFGIAAVKAFLVMAWFMHLKYDDPKNRMIFATGFIFLALLFTMCALDIFTRIHQGSIL